jgi:uncharacterized protein YndB with AHSA1/START domain
MAWVHGTIDIGRPVAEVFDYVADQSHEPEYNPRMVRAEKITAGPVAKGTRFRSVVATGGHAVPMQIECTHYERPKLLTTKTTMRQADISYLLRFDPAAGGTRMHWSGQVRLKGALRLLGPAVAWLGNRQEQRIWTSMKQHLETAAGAMPAASAPAGQAGWPDLRQAAVKRAKDAASRTAAPPWSLLK